MLITFNNFKIINIFTFSAVCLGSLTCWKMKSLPIRCLRERIAWWVRICLYFSAFIIPSIVTKSPTPFAVKHPLTIIELPPCLTVGFKYTSFIYSPTLLLTNRFLFELKISNLDSSLRNTFFHCSTFHFLCSLANSSYFCVFFYLR